MAKLYFKYGVMNSSKTANLLMVAHNYESQGRRILCLKSALDTRWSDGKSEKQGNIESRAIPNPHSCELVSSEENLYNLIKQYNNETIARYSSALSAILVDEAQFLTKEQVKQLSLVVEKLDIDVLCFGLKNTYKDGELFAGTSALLYYASSIEEIKTICKYCNRKATMNLRIVNGKAIYTGDSDVAIGDVTGGSDTYAQVCYHHYLNPPAPIVGMGNQTKQSYADKFNHILKYQNPFGFFRKTSEIAKQDYSFALVYPIKNKNDFRKLKYIVFGPICIDLEAYCKKYSKNKSINSIALTDCIIRFLYHYFENNTEIAFRLLKNSTCTYVEFYENDEEYQESLRTRTETTQKGYRKLPDGRYYFIDAHTKNSWNFYQSVLTGFSMQVNNIEVGFYYDDNTEA